MCSSRITQARAEITNITAAPAAAPALRVNFHWFSVSYSYHIYVMCACVHAECGTIYDI